MVHYDPHVTGSISSHINPKELKGPLSMAHLGLVILNLALQVERDSGPAMGFQNSGRSLEVFGTPTNGIPKNTF